MKSYSNDVVKPTDLQEIDNKHDEIHHQSTHRQMWILAAVVIGTIANAVLTVALFLH
jgi:hypothetical protein